MASSIVTLIDPLTKEEHWFDPNDMKKMCEMPNDTIEWRGTSPIDVKYVFDNIENEPIVTIQGNTTVPTFNYDIESALVKIDAEVFAHELADAAYGDGFIKDMPCVVRARQQILDEIRTEIFKEYLTFTDGFKINGFGYIYVGDVPAMTIGSLLIKNSSAKGYEMEFGKCAGLVNIKNAIAPLRIAFHPNYDATKTIRSMEEIKDFSLDFDSIWQKITFPMYDNDFPQFSTTNSADAFVECPEPILENINDDNAEEAYQAAMRLITGIVPKKEETFEGEIDLTDLF